MSCTILYLSQGEWYIAKNRVPMVDGKPQSFHFSENEIIHRFIIGESTYDSLYERIGPPGKLSFPMKWIDESTDEFFDMLNNRHTDSTITNYEDDYDDDAYFSDDSEGYWFSINSRKIASRI